MSESSQLPLEIREAIQAYGGAMFDCGDFQYSDNADAAIFADEDAEYQKLLAVRAVKRDELEAVILRYCQPNPDG